MVPRKISNKIGVFCDILKHINFYVCGHKKNEGIRKDYAIQVKMNVGLMASIYV